MGGGSYSMAQLVADLRVLKERAGSEARTLAAARNFVQRLAGAKGDWLRPSMCVPGQTRGTAGVHALHEEPDHSLALFVVTWLPGEETPPHDHGTWAIIAGLQGRETNHLWKRIDDGSQPGHARIERTGRQSIQPGVVVAMAGDAIHSVHNDSDGLSVTLHLYGVNVDYTERRRFDPATDTTAPYRMGGTLATRASA